MNTNDDSVKIAILSQNAVSDKNTQPITVEDIEGYKPEIYIEMTQEDTRKLPVMSQEFLNNYDNVHNEELLKLSKVSGYNVKIKVFKRVNFATNPTDFEIIAKGSIPIDNKQSSLSKLNPIVTKGAVYVKLKLKNNHPIVFVNAHLPMLSEKNKNGDTKDTLGNEFRTKSFLQILEKLQKDGIVDNNTTLFFGGDLNFRIGCDGSDQLTKLLMDPTQNNLGLKELKFPDPRDKRFTCKFENSKDIGNTTTCRNTSVPPGVENPGEREKDFFEIMNKVQRECGVANRLPSRCDRFLIKYGDKSTIQTLVHRAEFFPEIQSDHNTLYAVITYENTVTPGSVTPVPEKESTFEKYTNSLFKKSDTSNQSTTAQSTSAQPTSAKENFWNSTKKKIFKGDNPYKQEDDEVNNPLQTAGKLRQTKRQRKNNRRRTMLRRKKSQRR
jgi:hypothetical protein